MPNNIFSSLTPVTRNWQMPEIITVTDEAGLARVKQLIATKKVIRFLDPMEYAADELYDIAYPHEKDLSKAEKKDFAAFKVQYDWPKGIFAYFPWSGTLLRLPNKEELRALRTSRNRNLITADEQKELYKATVFVAGLSVGSNIVEALVSMGIGGTFILADMDVIEPSNLNRIRAPYHDVGVHKTDAVAMRMSEIDPYLNFRLYRDGVTEENLHEILDTHSPTVIIDEMDQVQLKITLRKEAKKRGLPILSAADDGDSTLLDIERYDLSSETPLFNGLIPEEVIGFLENATEIPRQQLGMLIGKYFVGPENIPLRMYQSLGEVGKTLPSWPQLGGAATQSGIAVAYAVRRIILQQPLEKGRFVIGPDQILDPELREETYQAELAQFKEHLEGVSLSSLPPVP